MRRRPENADADATPATRTEAQLFCGDALALLPTLRDRSVNLCLTSPPYAMQRKRQYGGVPEKEYPSWMCRVMAALRPKLTHDGSVLLVVRSHVRDGVVSDYVLRTRLAIRESGWIEPEELIWLKPDAPPLGSKQRPRRTWEHILWFSRTPKPFINLHANGGFSDRLGFVGSHRIRQERPVSTKPDVEDGKARTADHFTASWSETENGIPHPAMFPVSLCEKLIRTFSREGDVLLDCFAGSGNALLAAQRTGRKFIGFDIKKEYVELAAKRLNATFTEHATIINPGQQVRLRTDFPDTARSRRIYFKSRDLNESDAAVFEFVLSMTVNSSDRTAAAELSHNQIAAATKLSRRTVIRSIERLEKAGLIEAVKHEEWHKGNANRITLPSSLLVPLEIPASDSKRSKRRHDGTRLQTGD